jgi:hypothetical protein
VDAPIGAVGVDTGQIVIGDANTIRRWALEPADGLFDCRFWGRDQDAVATAMHAPQLADRTFGWIDLTEEQADERAKSVEAWLQAHSDLFVRIVAGPHGFDHTLQTAMIHSSMGFATVSVEGASILGLQTGYGDGNYHIVALTDQGAQATGLRIVMDTELDSEALDDLLLGPAVSNRQD